MSRRDWRERFLVWTRRRGRAETTIKGYRVWLGVLAKYLDLRGLSHPREVTRGDIADLQAYLMTLRTQRGRPYASATRVHILAFVKTLFEQLIEGQQILVDPTVGMRLPRVGRRLPKTLVSWPEMRRVLSVPDTSTFWGLRDRAILEVLYGVGLRFSEMADLAVGDLDLDGRLVWVRQGKGRRDRVLPLGRWAIYWLRRYLAGSDKLRRNQSTERVFLTPMGNRLANTVFNGLLRRYARRARITKPISAHAIRHAFATHLLKGGADVRYIQRLLGHTKLSSTEVYTHLDLSDLRRVQQRHHPRERRRARSR